jgi:hypothetical protein
VHIGAAGKGRSCKLHCPECSGALDAKQGKKNRWHFAHQSVTWCNGVVCDGAPLKTAHTRAQEIIAEHQVLTLPAPAPDGTPFALCFTASKVEVPLELDHARRIDVVLYKGSLVLGVEICVHHAVDDEKAQDLKGWEFPTVEIEIEPTLANADSEEPFISHVLHTAKRHWIHQAGLFSGTEEDPDKYAMRVAVKHRLQTVQVRQHFISAVNEVRAVDPELCRELVDTIRPGTSGSRHICTYTATQIGTLLGITAQRVGSLANEMDLPAPLLKKGEAHPWGHTWIGFYVKTYRSIQALLALTHRARELGLTDTAIVEVASRHVARCAAIRRRLDNEPDGNLTAVGALANTSSTEIQLP